MIVKTRWGNLAPEDDDLGVQQVGYGIDDNALFIKLEDGTIKK